MALTDGSFRTFAEVCPRSGPANMMSAPKAMQAIVSRARVGERAVHALVALTKWRTRFPVDRRLMLEFVAGVMQVVTSADTDPVDYTKWSEVELNRLRTLQRDEELEPSEREAVEHELQRRAHARAVSSPALSATPPISAPAPGLAPNTPVVNGRQASVAAPSVARPRNDTEPPPFSPNGGRRGFVSALSVGFVFAALAAGAGGAIAGYSLGEGLGSGRMAFAVLVAIIAAMPYLVIVAFLDLASEAAQGVTWIATFLHERPSE